MKYVSRVLFPRPELALLFAARFIRLFAYGSLSVVLVFYLIGIGLTESQTGLLVALTLIGDTAVSLVITTRADRVGRRKMLLAGALLMVGAGLVFAATRDFWLLLLAATIGVISPSGQRVGPFLPIEQAMLAHLTTDENRTRLFGWYTLTGSLAAALGALAGRSRHAGGRSSGLAVESYRAVVILYAALDFSSRLCSGVCRVTPNTGGARPARARIATNDRQLDGD